MANYLVTGGAGFVGSHLCRRLLEEGHAVRVLDDLSSGRQDNLAEIAAAVDFRQGDLRDPDILDATVRDIDFILHHAAVASVQTSVERPLFEQDVNAVGTLRLLEAARQAGVKRLVFAASAAAYGNNPANPKGEEMVPEPCSPYGISKVCGEYYCRVYSQLYGLETVALRYFNIFGPRQDPASPYSGVISIFVNCMEQGQRPVVFGDGLQERDFVYVDNVVEANILACQIDQAAGEIYNIGCGQGISIAALVEHINQINGTSIGPQYAAERPGDVRLSLADISRARAVLGYEPVVPFELGLERTVEWMQSQR
ncbi:MAG: NAD-dependent epimerase/dehydratase family protein [Candidatus Latescibacteria bacterium]|nr:NAD-dependent epimerase/dehydratase family protein [Candidatus Latescibacterota bacterium]